MKTFKCKADFIGYQCRCNIKPNEKPMENKVIFESEEEFDKFYDDIEHLFDAEKDTVRDIFNDKGYIRKSPVEKAEENYKRYVSWARGMCDKEDGQYILIEKLWEAVQYLKAGNKRLKNES